MRKLVATLCTGSMLLALATPSFAEDERNDYKVKHVLLISVDGLHAVDLARYVKDHPDSALRKLSNTGVTYTNASTPKPSDSFPGILALVTGGTPVSTGVWYDDSYDRKLAPPLNNSQGGISGTCTPGVFPGTEILYDETIEKDKTKIDGGGGIDPNALPRDPANNCAPLYPHSFLRVNTIFEVIRATGRRTAWADKHLAYDLVNGPSGKGVDDLYTPEIAGNGDATKSLPTTVANDELKVQAILNEIDGRTHDGSGNPGVPAMFGMNFQSVSVGQKLTAGGYVDSQGQPNALLATALQYVDSSLGKFVAELKSKELYEKTLIVVTAKHGQSPIDKTKLRRTNTSNPITRPSKILATDAAQVTEDDISLIWLKSASSTESDVAILQSNNEAAAIQKIYADDLLKLVFDDPTKDSRTPDIIVQPELGVIYTGSTAKIAEHGGFSEDDTHVALLLSLEGVHSRTVKSPVETMQVAPTILSALGINPEQLKAVAAEKTAILPGLRTER